MASAGSWIAARKRAAAAAAVVALAMLAVVASTALATVTVSRAQLSGTRLKLEGRALANRTITVDGASLGASDGSGTFRIDRQPFSAPGDCTVDVNDRSASPTAARLSGCTVAAPLPPPPSGGSPPTSLSLSHSSLDQVGTLATAGVTFAANPTTPLDFAVQSSHPDNAAVPASVHVDRFADPGNPVASFSVTYASAVSAPTQVTISVSAGGVTKTAPLTLNPTPAPTLGSGERGPGFVGSDFTTFATQGTTIALGPNGVGPLRADIIAGQLPERLVAGPAGMRDAREVPVRLHRRHADQSADEHLHGEGNRRSRPNGDGHVHDHDQSGAVAGHHARAVGAGHHRQLLEPVDRWQRRHPALPLGANRRPIPAGHVAHPGQPVRSAGARRRHTNHRRDLRLHVAADRCERGATVSRVFSVTVSG